MLVDSKQRRYLVTMVPGAQFHTHAGIVEHDDIIGQDEGRHVEGTTARTFLVLLRRWPRSSSRCPVVRR